MITNEFAEAATEITEILSYLPNEYIQKIPKKLRDFFEKVKSNNYISKINPYKPLEKQDIKPKTKTLLVILYRNYWCDEEEKERIDRLLIENDRKYEKELREKYNPDNLFKNRNHKTDTVNDTLDMIEYKESFLTKFINKFKSVFHIK